MRKIAHTAPGPLIPWSPVEGAPTPHVTPHPIVDRVERVRWFATTGKAHAFMVPEGALPAGKVRAMCPASLDSAKMRPSTDDQCLTCRKAAAEDTRKRGTGLTEPTTEIVATGAQHGPTREAESRRAGEIAEISGDAGKANAAIVGKLREGDVSEARTLARKIDRRGPQAPVPEADMAPIGNRDHGMLDGVAMVQGPNQAPVQPMWRNPKTGEIEPRAAYLTGSLRERIDRTIIPREAPKRSNASKRRYRARLTAERKAAERKAAEGK